MADDGAYAAPSLEAQIVQAIFDTYGAPAGLDPNNSETLPGIFGQHYELQGGGPTDDGLFQEIGLGSEIGPALALFGLAAGGAGLYAAGAAGGAGAGAGGTAAGIETAGEGASLGLGAGEAAGVAPALGGSTGGLFGGGGVLGTGLTTAQTLKLALQAGTLGTTLAGAFSSGGSGGGGSGGGNGITVDGRGPTPGQEEIFRQLRQLGLATSRERQAVGNEALIRETAQANASPQELLASLRPAISQIRQKLQQQFRTASRQFGPSGGGQIERAQGQSAADAGTLLQTLLTSQPTQGLGSLLATTKGFRPVTLAALPEEVTTNVRTPNQFGDIPGAVKGFSQLNKFIDTNFGTSAGTADSTQAQNAIDSYRNAGFTWGLPDAA